MKKLAAFISTIIVVVLIASTYIYINQKPVELKKYSQPNTNVEIKEEALSPVNDEKFSYSLQKNELNITYNKGLNWTKVDIETDLLFQGEYQGNKKELIKDSYIINEDLVAFLYTEYTNDNLQRILLKYSYDKGSTWEESVVVDDFPVIRYRKVDFLTGNFGYVIISGGRTMSQEYSAIYLTRDGGETWEKTSELPSTRLIAFGAFIDEKTGFLSYGTISPEEPDFYVTYDSGSSWNQSNFEIPEIYEEVFVQAEVPIKVKEGLEVLVNQGPNGDYKGNKVKGKFISEDNGFNWIFDGEVNIDETQ